LSFFNETKMVSRRERETWRSGVSESK